MRKSSARLFILHDHEKLFENFEFRFSFHIYIIPRGTLGINIFAKEINTKTFCVADDSGDKTCITKSQLDALILNAGTTPSSTPLEGGGGEGGGNSEPTPEPASEPVPEPTPEVIPEPEPVVEVIVEPEPTPEPVPEPTPEPAPTPEPEVTP